mmetsp:Transcript_13728/g.2198  ORF Transcript_13728/g.2198 Transcript_13728/m.2198 type:complete len:205 (-) Transcript_13728:1009-1623(-)|eukprot:CAMPEP_0168315030 /NCGR_PEP_ID=MMETSP0210-20121227/9944_1 /TAXON_ID=40633 /ORGANISM="Condylostoma magnum, Strain COL2" /LENGTH=204 /DNA_ID=CAMNT_0008286001 /DNA_START=1791 /DNA_END=2405 /DNA_ORIENTATION=-
MDIFENLVLERDVMLLLDHPFVVKLVKTFKDAERVYFLMEFVRGLDLFDALREIGLVTGPNAKFYTASLILILEHLHSHEIIYRDLKPENVMVDKDGYIKLIDFGTARIIKDRTFTIVGTPHYMAPEVIKGKGYFMEADFWSLGIMLYEFMCGGVPFGDDVDDPLMIYDKIIEYNLKFPIFFKGNDEAKDIIRKLLNPNPAMRI